MSGHEGSSHHVWYVCSVVGSKRKEEWRGPLEPYSIPWSLIQSVNWGRERRSSSRSITRNLLADKERWAFPLNGSVKVNVDDAFSSEEKEDAAGTVIRDDEGSFCVTRAR